VVVRAQPPLIVDFGSAVILEQNDVVDLQELIGWIVAPPDRRTLARITVSRGAPYSRCGSSR
jgi:hypothetical protein